MDLLHDNHYSTVCDLEEDSFEIERFAMQRQNGAITYLELDTRSYNSNSEIQGTIDLFSNQKKKLLWFKNLRFYQQQIDINEAQGFIKTKISQGRGDLQMTRCTIDDEKRFEETFEKFGCAYQANQIYDLKWGSTKGWNERFTSTYFDSRHKITEEAETYTAHEGQVIASMVTSNLDDLSACKVTANLSYYDDYDY